MMHELVKQAKCNGKKYTVLLNEDHLCMVVDSGP